MKVSPLEYRYGSAEMKKIFSRRRRTELLLRCEGALALAQERLGMIPPGTGKRIHEVAVGENISLERLEEVEKVKKHETMALITLLEEGVGGEASGFVHLGATSSDMLDTATALQMKEGNERLEGGLETLIRGLTELAARTKNTVCVGRTHGQHAVPMTFGFKVGVWVMEFQRHLERLGEIRSRTEVGKMSGAVGTGAAFGEGSAELERKVMELLELGVEELSTQVVQRDRYVELLAFLANVATSLSKIATEVRNLQRTEIGEVREEFDREGQVGSSTMPQKTNPVLCENICGLARIIRSAVVPAMENAVLWHERDLANSSSERFLIPQTYILADDILGKTARVVAGLSIDQDRMRKNIADQGYFCMAEAVIMDLVRRGLKRSEAHEKVRRVSLEAKNRDIDLRSALSEDAELRDIFSKADLERLLDPGNYLGHSVEKIERYVEKG